MKILLLDKFKPLFETEARYIVITGGRGSSKSFSVNTFLKFLTYEKGHKILFSRYTLTSAQSSIIPEFIEKIEITETLENFDITKSEITNKKTGSQIVFKGIKTSSGNQTANLKSLNGITTFVLDEAEEMADEKTFDDIDFSVRDQNKQNRVIIILNPTTKEHWIFKRFFESAGVQPGFNGTKGNVTYIHTDYRDNIQHLSQSFLDQVENIRINNPAKYEHQILGGWLDKAEGVIFTNWKIGDFEEVSVPVFGMDFGFSIDPTTLVKTCVDKSNKKIYVKECFYKPKLTTSEIYSLSKNHAGNSLIYGDSAEPRLINELSTAGLNIKPTIKGAGSITAGIALMQDYELIIDPNSTNLIKELNNYVWSDKKSDTPIDAYNHGIDSVRYSLTDYISNKQDLFFF